MTARASATIIERDYADCVHSQRDPGRTTSFIGGPLGMWYTERMRPTPFPRNVSAILSYEEYVAQFSTEFYSAFTREYGFYCLSENAVGNLSLQGTDSSRRRRYAEVIALLEKWLADDSGYDEEVWPDLKEKIEQSRTSTRRRFGD